jgi:hypothetical protein
MVAKESPVGETTPEDVAAWMVKQIGDNDSLYQSDAVREMRERFGEEFLYWDNNGNDAISEAVLSTFRELSGDRVVWLKQSLLWETRKSHHQPGRAQDR